MLADRSVLNEVKSKQVNRVALVTGGAIRVGRAISKALLDQGYQLWLHYNRSEDAARELEATYPEQILGCIQCDLTDEQARTNLCEQILNPEGKAEGAINVLINNAASFESGKFLERNDRDLRRVLETNLVAPISLCRRLAPQLSKTSEESNQASHIINIIDLGAHHPWNGYLDHCVAKAGLSMATRSLALELAPSIHVNAIAPGTVMWPEENEFQNNAALRQQIESKIPLGHAGTAEDVASTVLFLLASTHIHGTVIDVDGGRSANFGR